MKELNYQTNISFIKSQIGYLRNHNTNSPLMETFNKMTDNKIDFFEVLETFQANYNDLKMISPNANIGDLELKIFKIINNDFSLAKSPNGNVVAIKTKDCLWRQQSKGYCGAGKKPHIKVSTFIKEGETIIGTNFVKTPKGWRAYWFPTIKAVEKAYETRVCDL